MAAVRSLCQKGLLLVDGKIHARGSIESVLNEYQLLSVSNTQEISDLNRRGSGICRVVNVQIKSQEDDLHKDIFKLGEKIKINLTIKNSTNRKMDHLRVVIGVYNLNEEGFLRFDTNATNTTIEIGADEEKEVTCLIEEHLNIKPDHYRLNIAIFDRDELIDHLEGVSNFSIENYDYYGTGRGLQNQELSKVFYKHSWIRNSE
jgi:hypothetical protein